MDTNLVRDDRMSGALKACILCLYIYKQTNNLS